MFELKHGKEYDKDSNTTYRSMCQPNPKKVVRFSQKYIIDNNK